MATTEPGVLRRNWIAVTLVGAAILAVGVIVYFSLRTAPQMGTSEEVFNTVDALFTAVTAKDERLLNDCEKRLKSYRDAGQLPPAAADALDAIIRKARSGAWETAAERLYDFMKAQKREGVIDHGHEKKTKGTSKR